jgi:protein-disulfide isomerase
MVSDAVKDRITNDQSDGYDVNVQGTPTFFVNGEAQRQFDYNSLKNAIQAAL